MPAFIKYINTQIENGSYINLDDLTPFTLA